jgi:hypothetical protein
MALITGGTTGTTVLLGMKWNASGLAADIAQINNNIKYQANPAHPLVPGAFANNGLIDFPDRAGFMNLLPGDYVFYDSFGWPIVVSRESIAAGGTSWAHS